MADCWFWPTVIGGGEDAVLFAAETFGFTARKMLDLTTDPGFQKHLRKRVSIRRAWGPLGLFWALLLERLESLQSFLVCERCQRPIVGKKGKRFCSSKDNPACYLKRRASDRKHSRSRRH